MPLVDVFSHLNHIRPPNRNRRSRSAPPSSTLDQFHATGDKQLRLVVIQCADQHGCDKNEPELRIPHQRQSGVRRRAVLSTRAAADT
jgi:hypothetical protein